MELLLNNIDKIFSKQKQKDLPKKIAVAVSGGCDSLALTIALNEYCLVKKIKLFAVTINHKIRKGADKEATQLNKILNKNKISHQILEIKWSKKPISNIESKLREARYELLYEFCLKNKIEFLFLGHQLEDVAENFLIRLFRGSGLDGLSTMAEIAEYKKIKLLRPFLNITKNQLKEFLQSKKIKWFEDETNEDEKFLRNKIRKFFNSFEDKDLIQKRIKISTDEIAQMRDLFDLDVVDKAKEILQFQDNSFLINLEKFKIIPEKIALKILALTTMEISGKEYKPRLERLTVFYDWILLNKTHKARDFYGCVAKKYDDNSIIIYKKIDPIKSTKALKNKAKTSEIKLKTILKKLFQHENS